MNSDVHVCTKDTKYVACMGRSYWQEGGEGERLAQAGLRGGWNKFGTEETLHFSVGQQKK